MTNPNPEQAQQNQSGGVNLGAGNSIAKVGDLVDGDKIGGDEIKGNQLIASTIIINEAPTEHRSGDAQPSSSLRDKEIDRYVWGFSNTVKGWTSQGVPYKFPLTFQQIDENGEPIADTTHTPIDQLMACVQNASSRKVILRGAAGAGKTTVMRRTAEWIHQLGYDTILPVYIELRRLDADTLQRLNENVGPDASAESYLEPLLRAANTQPNIETLRCLGDYAEEQVERTLLILVDGLNEVYGEETARFILNRLDSYITKRSGACVIISDRITPRDTTTWQVARIERIPEELIAAQFKNKHREAEYNQLGPNDRSLLQTAYFLNYALEHNTARLSSAAEAIGAFFAELAGALKFNDDVLDLMAQAAFDAYKTNRSPKFDADAFAQAIGAANFAKLIATDVVTRLPADAATPGAAPQAQFDHPLKHDYLAARYLSKHSSDWTPETLDVVSFESNSFDALAMTLELLHDELLCDTFIQRVHNWNWAAALTCIAKAMRTGSSRHSQEIQLAVLALVAEKTFDRVQQTRKRATEVLALFPPDTAEPYKLIRNRSELNTLVANDARSEARNQNTEQWYTEWRDLFMRSDDRPLGEQDLKQIVDPKGIIGWTAANVFRRRKLSDLDVRQLHAYYDACDACDYNDWRASTIRSRVVHALGGTDTNTVVEMLLDVLNQDKGHYIWVRIVAARSLIEIAALTADGELRGRVIDSLSTMVKIADSKILALKTLYEIGQSAFYAGAYDGWQQAVTPLITLMRNSQSEPEKKPWADLLNDFTAYCQDQVLLAGSVGGGSATPNTGGSGAVLATTAATQ